MSLLGSELCEGGEAAHLSACVWQLDVLGGGGHIDGSPHENVQVVHFGIFLFGDKVSKCVKEVRNVLRDGQ